jgi:hypothetical protein
VNVCGLERSAHVLVSIREIHLLNRTSATGYIGFVDFTKVAVNKNGACSAHFSKVIPAHKLAVRAVAG